MHQTPKWSNSVNFTTCLERGTALDTATPAHLDRLQQHWALSCV